MTNVTIWEAAGANGGTKASLERLGALLQQGESVNQPNWAGCTPLHCAAPEMNLNILKFLLESGADVNKATPYGLTPLHFACYYGRLDNVELLLAYGANIGARTHDGYTPKDKAIEGQKGGRAKGPDNKFTEVIDLLNQCEANPQRQQQLRLNLGPGSSPPTSVPPKAAPPVSEVPSIDVDSQLQSLVEQLERAIQRHKQTSIQVVGTAKVESFQKLLREIVEVANAFEKNVSLPSVASWNQTTPAAAPTAPAVPVAPVVQPVPTAPAVPMAPQVPVPPAQPVPPPPMPMNQAAPQPPVQQQQVASLPPQMQNPQATQQSMTYLNKWQPDPTQAVAAPTISPAPTQPQQPDTKAMVLFENHAPDPAADYYTQQYQRYLEHVKAGARTNAVYSGDYFSSGAQSARTVFPGQATYAPYSAAAAPQRPSQPAWPAFGTAYQPPQHPAYGIAFAAPTFSYNPFGQPQVRW